jgi:release factor glutamine methyltransferase
MPEAKWTILKLIQWTTTYFKEQGVSEPRASAEILLAHVLSVDRLSLYLNYDRPLGAAELAAFKEFIKRRLEGEPVQYVTGTKEFWSLPLRVSPAVLIPRPETELLVEAFLDFLRKRRLEETCPSIIDLGTGSGAIAIALARELSLATVVAADLSLAALQLARENARKHQVAERIHFVCSDLFSGIRMAGAGFDAVVANPPYVRHSEFDLLPREIRNHEPREALDGGPDGLAAIRLIIQQAPAFLNRSGVLVLEIGAGQAEQVSDLILLSGRYQSHRFIPDYSGIDRVLVAERTEHG